MVLGRKRAQKVDFGNLVQTIRIIPASIRILFGIRIIRKNQIIFHPYLNTLVLKGLDFVFLNPNIHMYLHQLNSMKLIKYAEHQLKSIKQIK